MDVMDIPDPPPALPDPPPAEPDIPPAVPDIPPAVPDIPPAVPDIPPTVPDIPPAVPDLPPTVPDILPAVPSRPPAVPGRPSAVPNIPPAVPGRPPAVPGRPSAVPGLPPAAPGRPSAVPGLPPAAPGRPSAVPGLSPALLDLPPAPSEALRTKSSIKSIRSNIRADSKVKFSIPGPATPKKLTLPFLDISEEEEEIKQIYRDEEIKMTYHEEEIKQTYQEGEEEMEELEEEEMMEEEMMGEELTEEEHFEAIASEIESMKFKTKGRLLKELKDLEEVMLEYAGGYDEEMAARVNKLVANISLGMKDLKSFLIESRNNIEALRTPISKITMTIAQKVSEISKETVPETPEMCSLGVQHKRLGKQLAILNDELIMATKQTAEAELASLEAQTICEETCALAEKLKEDMERKKKEMIEANLQMELEKQRELELLLAERKRQEEEDIEQKLKELELQEEAYTWPTFPIEISHLADFDGGVGCLVKTDPAILYQRDIQCEVIHQNVLLYPFLGDEELVSHVIRVYMSNLECNDGAIMFNPGLCLSFPHCMPKQQSNAREVVVKLLPHPESDWLELKTSERTLEDYKDIRFAQAQTTFIGTFIVVSRNKQATVRIKRRSGKYGTSLDSKVLFKTTADAMIQEEKMTMQMHPIDQGTMRHLKKSVVAANNLLTTSAMFNITWTNKRFLSPIKMNICLPPNPAILKRMVKSKPLKEEETKKTNRPSVIETEFKVEAKVTDIKQTLTTDLSLEHEDDTRLSALNKPIHWYLGIYDTELEDESDNIFFLRKKKDKWIVDNIPIERTALLDVVEITLKEPVEWFILFRTTTRINNTKDAETIMAGLNELVGKKIVQFVLSQHTENHSLVIATVLPYNKVERYVSSMIEKEFNPIFAKDKTFLLKEGQRIKITFRGNIQSKTRNLLETCFYTNFDCSMILTLREHDVFVQKCYDVYRGFVQVSKLHDAISLDQQLDHKKSAILQPIPILDEQLITLPKDAYILAGKPIPRSTITYRDINCDLKLDILTKLSNELDKEWMDLGVALGLSTVLLHTIESNAFHYKKQQPTKIFEMLKNWIKIQYRLSNKIDTLCSALIRINRPDLVKIFELPSIAPDEESEKTEHTDLSKSSWLIESQQRSSVI